MAKRPQSSKAAPTRKQQHYLVQFSYTSAAWDDLLKTRDPLKRDRVKAVGDLVTRLGGCIGKVTFPCEDSPQAIDASRASGGMVNHASEVTRLGEALLLAGRLDEARELAEHALDLAQKHKERGNEALALRLLAEVSVGRSGRNASTARDLYEQARQIAGELGMEPLLGACQSALTPMAQP